MRKRSINRREPPPADQAVSPELAAELAAEAAEIPEGGLGLSRDPRDYIWLKNPTTDPIVMQKELEGDIWPFEALERIIREIVRSFPNVNVLSERGRVLQVMHHLVGTKLRTGPAKNPKDRMILKKLAPELLKRELGLSYSHFATLVKKQEPEIAALDDDPTKQNEVIDRIWKEFDDHMDEYLAEASWSDAPEQVQRRATTDQVIQLLRQLGYIRT